MEKVIHLLPSVLLLTAFICEVRWLYKIVKADSIIGGAVCSILGAGCLFTLGASVYSFYGFLVEYAYIDKIIILGIDILR